MRLETLRNKKPVQPKQIPITPARQRFNFSAVPNCGIHSSVVRRVNGGNGGRL
jgi:hypothetical protein